jgi:hypothetical protein
VAAVPAAVDPRGLHLPISVEVSREQTLCLSDSPCPQFQPRFALDGHLVSPALRAAGRGLPIGADQALLLQGAKRPVEASVVLPEPKRRQTFEELVSIGR